MPKLKTRKAAAKRFTSTASGKFRYAKANKQHILGKKSSRRKRKLRIRGIVDKTNQKAVQKMLPYA